MSPRVRDMSTNESTVRNFDPEQHGWHLGVAVMRTARPRLLAAIREIMQELIARGLPSGAPDWWFEDLAPPAASPGDPGGSDRDLMLVLGSLVRAVERWFLGDLYEGKLVCWGRPGSLADYRRAPAWAVAGIESWCNGGGIVRLQSGERLFAVRVEPPATSRTVSGKEIEEWLRAHPDMSERDGLPAALRDLGGKIPRSRFRAVRRRLDISLRAGRK